MLALCGSAASGFGSENAGARASPRAALELATVSAEGLMLVDHTGVVGLVGFWKVANDEAVANAAGLPEKA